MSKQITTSRRYTATRMVEALLLAIVVLGLIAAVLASGSEPRASLETRTIKVASGETLWDLASRHTVPGMTTAETVEHIAAINGLTTAKIIAGQPLEVPADTLEGALAAR